MTFKEFVEEGRIIKTQTHGYILYRSVGGTKLLQKSEMRKDIVIELSYKGFG